MEQAIRALTLVLSAGHFGVVVFDAAEAPADAWRRLPFTTWLRLERMVEGQQTMCVLVGSEPMARSRAGLIVKLAPHRSKLAAPRVNGLDFAAEVVGAHRQTSDVQMLTSEA